MFIVPGSCPASIGNITAGGVTTFQPLTVVSPAAPVNETLTFAVPGAVSAGANSVVYLSGQHTPVTQPISNVNSMGGMTYFNAPFPFQSTSQFALGLTIAAVVNGTGNFANSSAVAAATVYGPGLIEL